MRKKNTILTFLIILILTLSSCGKIGGRGLIMSNEQSEDIRSEQIVTALKEKNKDSLKSLFSKKALDEAKNFENEVDYLFDFLHGTINTWVKESGTGSKSIEYGKKTSMCTYCITISTDEDEYDIFVFDYNIDTINPDNEGVYTLEVKTVGTSNSGKTFEERMTPGISIIE